MDCFYSDLYPGKIGSRKTYSRKAHSRKNMHLALFLLLLTLYGEMSEARCVNRGFVLNDNVVLEAYNGYYGRVPDLEGFKYWSTQIQTGYISPMLFRFGDSDEYQSLYNGLTDREKLDKLYQQLFNRPADPAGVDWYLHNGSLRSPLSTIAYDILGGATGTDLAVVRNRRSVAKHFISRVETSSAVEMPEAFYYGILKSVTDDASTASAACEEIDKVILEHGGNITNTTANKYGLMKFGSDECRNMVQQGSLHAKYEIVHYDTTQIQNHTLSRDQKFDHLQVLISEYSEFMLRSEDGTFLAHHTGAVNRSQYIHSYRDYNSGDLKKTYFRLESAETWMDEAGDLLGQEDRELTHDGFLLRAFFSTICQGQTFHYPAYTMNVISDAWTGSIPPKGYEPMPIQEVVMEVTDINALLNTEAGQFVTVKVKTTEEDGSFFISWLDDFGNDLKAQWYDTSGQLVGESELKEINYVNLPD